MIGAITSNIQNIAVSGFIFDGGGLLFIANDPNSKNISITGNTFRPHSENTNDWYSYPHMAVCFDGSYVFSGVTVSQNTFKDITYGNNDYVDAEWIPQLQQDWGIGAVSVRLATNFDISDNTFMNMGLEWYKDN